MCGECRGLRCTNADTENADDEEEERPCKTTTTKKTKKENKVRQLPKLITAYYFAVVRYPREVLCILFAISSSTRWPQSKIFPQI